MSGRRRRVIDDSAPDSIIPLVNIQVSRADPKVSAPTECKFRECADALEHTIDGVINLDVRRGETGEAGNVWQVGMRERGERKEKREGACGLSVTSGHVGY
jgi:hypothetical protein